MTESRLYRLYDHMRPSEAAMERLAALETAEHAPRRAPRRLALAAAVLAALLALGGIVYANDVFGVQDWIQRTYRRTGVDRRSAEVFVQGGTLVVRQGMEVRSFSGDPAWMLEHVFEIVEQDGETVLYFDDQRFVLTGVVGPGAAEQAEFSFTQDGEACRIVVQYAPQAEEGDLYFGRVYVDGRYYGFGHAYA